ncbi:MAG: helicase-exonuclease AddAB subunit AddA [Lachnospiraceae bacterium]|nr:helicase-exonuclease AddAB subunit AddA [Lachnospiraceae bacterium]
MPWTKEQEEAISLRGCDLLVAASAGSGKTAVLVERIIKHITDEKEPVDIDRLLVLTFTNAAAGEMRERIRQAIEKKLEGNPEDERLRRQITLLNAADIMTIHAFCRKVVRDNYISLNIDPSFRIADEAEMKLIKAKVMDSLFEEMYLVERNTDFEALIETYGTGNTDVKLKELINDVYDYVMASPFPYEWLKSAVSAYDVTENEISSLEWTKEIKKYAVTNISEALNIIQIALDIIKESGEATEYNAALLSDYEALSSILDRFTPEKNFFEFFKEIEKIEFQKLSPKKKNTDEVVSGKIKALREAAKGRVKLLKEEFLFKNPEKLVLDMKSMHPILKSLSEMVMLYDERISAVKKEELILDFSDLEHYCLKALLAPGSTEENIFPSEAAKELSKKYAEVLVDEYQDSNFIQEIILKAVSKNFSGEKNRFMVGDVKQSIYRFRLARPEIFMEKYDLYIRSENQDERLINLHENFRSRGNVLFCINYIFRQIMSKSVSDIDYTDAEELKPGGFFPSFNGNIGGETEVAIIDGSSEADTDEYEDEIKNSKYEIMYVADRINSLVNEEKFHVFNKQSGAYRPVEYRDIVVLLRSLKTVSEEYIEVFASKGIPAYAEAQSGFFDAYEIMLLVNFLKLVDNPRQDIPLLSVLRSPVYAFSGDELAEIKAFSKCEDFYDDIIAYEKTGEDEKLKSKLSEFLEDISKLRDFAVFSSINELIWKIIKDTAYLEYIGSCPGGKLRENNVSTLIDRACEYEKSGAKSLFDFIKYIEEIKNNSSEISTAGAFSGSENVVRIMSVHKSKGLEFPVVIAAGMGRMFNKRESSSAVIMHHKLGIGTMFIDYNRRTSENTLLRSAIQKKIIAENIAEEERILYVALTRAKEKLIITGRVSNLEKSRQKWLSLRIGGKEGFLSTIINSGKCYLDWIMPALLNHRDFSSLLDDFERRELDTIDPSSWKLSVVSQNLVLSNITSNKEKKETADIFCEEANIPESILNELERRMGYEYKYIKSIGTPASLSVSEIKRINQERRINQGEPLKLYKKQCQSPAFMQEGLKLSSAQKGSALHSVMERLDFSREYSIDEIKELIKLCVENEILTEEEAKSVKAESIYKFTTSDIFKRGRASSGLYKETPFVLELSAFDIYGEEECGNEELILVHGIIDCFFVEEGKVVLLDYKTDYVPENMGKKIAERYKEQLDIYQKAIENIFGKKVKEKVIYLFESKSDKKAVEL